MNVPRKKQRTFFEYLTRRGSPKEREYLFENLSLLLGSGMPVIEAFNAIKSEIRSPGLRRVVEEMISDVQSGISLSTTLENAGIFSPHAISLIRIGEKSGRLVENLKILAIEDQKERTFSSKLHSAAMYPAFVFTLTFIVGIGIAWFILPKISLIASQLKVTLPLVTKILMGIGSFLQAYGIIAVPLFVVSIIAGIYFVFFFPATKYLGESILFTLPGINKLLRETELARFGYLLGTLLSAGLSPTEALDSLVFSASFNRHKRLYRLLRKGISEGNSFKKTFALYPRSSSLIPSAIQQLIISGEQSGHLSETLLKIGKNFEDKTETTAKDLTVILEPVLLVIVWLGVVFVAIAVVLPIYSLIGGINSNGGA